MLYVLFLFRILRFPCYLSRMPSRYRRDVVRLKAEIVGRVLAGEAQRAICRSAGMPTAQTVRKWAKADPLFAAELLTARRRGDWMARFAFDEAKAAAFLARARAGEAINSLIGAPGMPSRKTYSYWTRTQGSFAEAVFALRQRRDAQIEAHGRARWRAFDPALADRVVVALHRAVLEGGPGEARLAAVLAADPELPCRPVLARWRREQPEFDRVLKMIFAARRARGPRVPEAVREEVFRHIVEGGSFASYQRRPGGPSRTTLRAWFRRDAAFAEAVSQACAYRENWYEDRILMAAEGGAAGPAAGTVGERERVVGSLKRHLARLRHRPGAVHRKRGAG
jgi:hypothetical protein